MLIAGAKRHAKEILEIFYQLNQLDNLFFFDDISKSIGDLIFDKFPVYKNINEIKEYLSLNPEFVLGLGNPKSRKIVAEKLIAQGGLLESIISKTAILSHFNVNLGVGLNIMQNAFISNCVSIEDGTLVNAFCSIHHDVIIGKYCELSPHSVLLGGCKIGSFTSIGSNATILPNIKIGNNVVVGAGSVVTTDIPNYSTVIGVPGKIVKLNN